MTKSPKQIPRKDKKKQADGEQVGDGVSYINICITGKTELGRMLAPFYESPFVHPYFGPFNCMEGFWHYIKNQEKDDRLRSLCGAEARRLGKRLTPIYIKGINFPDIINAANFYKIEQNEQIKKLLIESELPFDFYYLFGSGNLQIRPSGSEWMIKGFTKIREMMKKGERPDDIDYTQLFPKKS